jgi:hypothetical protein
MYQNPEIERENRTWVVLLAGYTKEGENVIHHNAALRKFEMPEKLMVNNKELKNNQGDATWFFLNRLDLFDTMTRDRIINAADISKEIVDLISYYQLVNNKDATIKNYDPAILKMHTYIHLE